MLNEKSYAAVNVYKWMYKMTRFVFAQQNILRCIQHLQFDVQNDKYWIGLKIHLMCSQRLQIKYTSKHAFIHWRKHLTLLSPTYISQPQSPMRVSYYNHWKICQCCTQLFLQNIDKKCISSLFICVKMICLREVNRMQLYNKTVSQFICTFVWSFMIESKFD